MTVYGWDGSDFDWSRGPMDLAAARADGITWFTHKGTESNDVQHIHLRDALERARDAGIEFIGAYHVVRSTPSVAEQVAYFLAYLDAEVPWWRDWPGFFLQVDLELWPYDKVSADTGMAFAAELVAAQPKTVITYASRGQYGNSLTGIVTPLWNAAYHNNQVAHYLDAYPGDDSPDWLPYSGQTPAMLQFGSQLTIGTEPGCDADAFRGTVDELRALIEGGDMPLSDEDVHRIAAAVWQFAIPIYQLDANRVAQPHPSYPNGLDAAQVTGFTNCAAWDAANHLAAGSAPVPTAQQIADAVVAAEQAAGVPEIHREVGSNGR